MLGTYGVVVNMVKWDFSKLLGVYVAFFALISILFGRFVFRENIPNTTWIGLMIIICGAMMIQLEISRARFPKRAARSSLRVRSLGSRGNPVRHEITTPHEMRLVMTQESGGGQEKRKLICWRC